MLKKTSKNAYSVLNSNIKNFCSPQKFANCHINRINPDKSTFLKSNLIVSNILNHLETSIQHQDTQKRVTKKHKNNQNDSYQESTQINDAYTNKDIQIKKDIEEKIIKKEKVEYVRNLAKCRSQTSMEELKKEHEEISKQIEQIAIMKIEMNQRARDIMGRKEDTAYLGRNLFLQGDKFLKGMKEGNPSDKVVKTQATRLLMKECANKKRKKMLNIISYQQESSFIVSPQQNQTINQSYLNNSAQQISTIRLSKVSQKKEDQKLMQLIKNKSFDCIMKEQKRAAAWNGFIQNWALGFNKNQDLISTKKKRKIRRSPKKYVDQGLQQHQTNILQYNSKYERHMALKKYKQNFNKTSQSYNIATKC